MLKNSSQNRSIRVWLLKPLRCNGFRKRYFTDNQILPTPSTTGKIGCTKTQKEALPMSMSIKSKAFNKPTRFLISLLVMCASCYFILYGLGLTTAVCWDGLYDASGAACAGACQCRTWRLQIIGARTPSATPYFT